MVPMELTTERLFNSGEFRPVDEGHIKRVDGVTFFPNQLWFAPASKVAVLVCFQSKNGYHYSISRDVLNLLRNLEMDGVRVKQGYVAKCHGEGSKNLNPQLDGCCTVLQQLNKLNGTTPMQGEHGWFFWVDEQGIPSASHDSGVLGRVTM